MKKQSFLWGLLYFAAFLAFSIIIINTFITLFDWVVRISGIFLIIFAAVVVFKRVRKLIQK